jgi:hypothetical protein
MIGRMTEIAVTVAAGVVAGIAAITYGLMIWASAHRS